MIIALTEAEREFCKKAADARTAENEGRRNVRGFDNPYYNLTNKQQGRLAVMAEGAVFKWLGGSILNHELEEWCHFTESDNYKMLKVPDLFGAVEVRRANDRKNGIALRKKDLVVAGTRIVQAYVPYTQQERQGPIKVGYNVELLGWSNPHEDYETAVPKKNDSYRCLMNKRPMETFDWSKELIAA